MLEIRAEQLIDKLHAGEPIEVVDIREPADFESWHIHGSRNLPVYDALREGDDAALLAEVDSLPRDRAIVAVCRGGVVSLQAAELLRSLGYDAWSLSGGMRGWGGVWSEAPIELPGAAGRTLLQIRRNGKGCLSYLFGGAGECAVVDPGVAVDAYTQAAERLDLRITHVLETHVHADHVSRARALCDRTGAELVLPPNQRVTYGYVPIAGGERLTVGGIDVRAIATPGHTGESTCYLLEGFDVLLTGDTLFVGRVGRPDLEKGDAGAERGARMLFSSLGHVFSRFDDLRFFPAHHSQPIGFDRVPIGSTLRDERARTDWSKMDEQAFVARVVASLGAKPPNFDRVIAINEGKADLLEQELLALEAGPNSCAAG